MAEINPLAMLDGGKFVALDAKVIIDDNALFRHDDLKKYEELSELENQAKVMDFHLWSWMEIWQLLVMVLDW